MHCRRGLPVKGAYEIGSVADCAERPRLRASDGKPAAAPISRSRARRGSDQLALLSEKMKIGLRVLLAEGQVVHDLMHWRGKKGGEIRRETMEALFDRHMVNVATDAKTKHRHTASLTEIGRLVAERLQIAEIEGVEHMRVGDISEAAQRLIVAMIDNFKDAPNVYPHVVE